VIQSQQNVLLEQDIKGFIAIEPFADVLDKVGMHQEARDYFQKIILSATDILTQARCWRKIAVSLVSQRDFINGGIAAGKAISLFQKLLLQTKSEREEYVKALHASAHSYYFQLKFEKLETIAKEIKKYLPDITDIELRCNLLHVISLSVYSKYRWYQFPEEAFNHLELLLQLTEKLEDKFNHAYAHCMMGHQYLYNEEFALSREHFSKAIHLLEGKHFGQLLIAYNYTAVSFRMQNNIAMTEQWANRTLEKAKLTSNISYVPYSYANLAWVYIKRENWLYAENYARKAADNWTTLSMIYSYAFPLMACLLRKDELAEAGELAFKIIHPRLKKFPSDLTQKLKTVVRAWIASDKVELRNALREAIDEAKISGYF
jgi:tetratricopeptide (TPR) repeat protein